jgi:hypothetical protein
MTNRIVLLLGLALGACAAPTTDASPVPAPARVADLEGGLLRLRTDHATVWLERPVRPEAGPESGPFVVRGWSSVPLTRVNATSPEGPLGAVHTPSPRRFEWAIDPDALTRLCDGRPAFLDVVAPATRLAVRVTLAARLEAAPDDAPDTNNRNNINNNNNNTTNTFLTNTHYFSLYPSAAVRAAFFNMLRARKRVSLLTAFCHTKSSVCLGQQTRSCALTWQFSNNSSSSRRWWRCWWR